MLTGTLALKAENTQKGAEVLIKDQGEKHWLEARKVIAEVENQGALMCGYQGSNALIKGLEGKNGIEDYVKWWKRSFEFLNPEIQRISQGYAIKAYYEDEEIDYLFSLLEGEVFPGSINQYKIPKMLWDAIFKHRKRITKERPEKISRTVSLPRIRLSKSGCGRLLKQERQPLPMFLAWVDGCS